MTGTPESSVERYVPTGPASLSSDAPGWGHNPPPNEQEATSVANEGVRPGGAMAGPTCWKCRGSRKVNEKKGTKKRVRPSPPSTSSPPHVAGNACDSAAALTRTCPVCQGRGYLCPKKSDVEAATGASSTRKPGMITGARRRPEGWQPDPPVAYAVGQMDEALRRQDGRGDGDDDDDGGLVQALRLLRRASSGGIGEGVTVPPPPLSWVGPLYYPEWAPTDPGEQLCNLVGTWRILQKVGSHRWTTDDLVTAHIASREILGSINNSPRDDRQGSGTLNYLDLGCGNASVLQMASWALMSKFDDLTAFGIEARAEAVGLARRSLAFNVGGVSNAINVVHADFRDLQIVVDDATKGIGSSANASVGGDETSDRDLLGIVAQRKFDLITGTPPYFRVDFSTATASDDADSKVRKKTVQSAVINQGGMPTAVQSAPARCEFRGGVEAYCVAASGVLSPSGTFVVCENWLNNHRVYQGAEASGLRIVRVLPVKGKESRKEALFGVYVMRRKEEADNIGDKVEVLPSLSVRDNDGKWTKEYANVLESMSIPARHEVVELGS